MVTDSYLNLETMLQSFKTLIDDFKNRTIPPPMLVFTIKNINIHLTALVVNIIAVLGKKDFLKIIMNTLKIIHSNSKR